MKSFKIFLSIMIIFFSYCSSAPKKSDLPEFNAAIEKAAAALKHEYREAEKNPEKKKLAVLTFVNDNSTQSQLGRSISNTIQTRISDIKLFALLERERTDSLLSEYELNESGFVSRKDSVKLGQMLDADLALAGTIVPNDKDKISWFTLTARIVDLKSGETLAIANVDMLANSDLIAKYGAPLQKKKNDISGAYIITISDLRVGKQKSNGIDWDEDSTSADVYVLITGKHVKPVRSLVYYDSYYVEGDFFKETIVLEKDDNVTLKVNDFDVLDTDNIGVKEFTTQEIIDLINKKEKAAFSFGQVESISIKIEKKK